MADRYRKKPVVIEAVQYDPPRNCREVWDFLGWPWNETDPTGETYHDPDDCRPDIPRSKPCCISVPLAWRATA